MSASTTLRPDNQITTHDGFGGTDWTYSNAGFSDGAVDLADDSDSTIWFNGNPHPAGQQTAEFDFNSFSLPAGANVVSVTIRIRWRPSAALTGTIQDRVGAGAARQVGTVTGIGLDNPARNTQSMTTQTTRPSGGAWTQSDIDSLNVILTKTSGAGWEVDELYADVVYSTPPTATVTAPTGTQTSTNQPTVTWSYADTESDAQTNFHVKIFSAADYGSGGFDPETWPAVWDSGSLSGADTSKQVGVALAADVTYKAYVKVADSPSGYGDWDDGPEFDILSTGRDTPGRVFFAQTHAADSDIGGFYEFDDDNREGTFTWKSAPLRDPTGRRVEIREVQVFARSYDGDATLDVTVNGTTRQQTMSIPGRHQLSFLFKERAEVLDVQIVSTAGDSATNEAPTIEVVRIGARGGHLAP